MAFQLFLNRLEFPHESATFDTCFQHILEAGADIRAIEEQGALQLTILRHDRMMLELVEEPVLGGYIKDFSRFTGEVEFVNDSFIGTARSRKDGKGFAENDNNVWPEGLFGEEVNQRFFSARRGNSAAFGGPNSLGNSKRDSFGITAGILHVRQKC